MYWTVAKIVAIKMQMYFRNAHINHDKYSKKKVIYVNYWNIDSAQQFV